MKINEIVTEDSKRRPPLRNTFKQATPGMVSYNELDNNNHPYLAYRFGVALAVSPNTHMSQEATIGSDFNMIDYTEADKEIRKGAENIMGIKSSMDTGMGSQELSGSVINKVSPVAKPRKNKYGV